MLRCCGLAVFISFVVISRLTAASPATARFVTVVNGDLPDASYRTTVELRNSGATPAKCRFELRSAKRPDSPLLSVVHVAPDQSTLLDEFLRELTVATTLRVNCEGDVEIYSRIHASSDQGKTFSAGRLFSAVSSAALATGAAKQIDTSSDVIVAEVTGKAATVVVKFTRKSDGGTATKRYDLRPFGQRILDVSGVSSTAPVRIDVQNEGAGAIVLLTEARDGRLAGRARRLSDEQRVRLNAHVAAAESLVPQGPSITQQLLISPFKAAPFRDPATGLVFMRDRVYDPSTGTFLTPDPEGYRDSSNPYIYGKGDPVNNSDPTGRETIPAEERKQIQCRTGVLNANSETCQRALHPEKFPELTGRGHVLEAYSSEPVYISLATLATADANTRLDLYASGLPGIQARVQQMIAQGVPADTAYRWGYEMRGALMKEARDASTPLGRYVAEMMKKEQPPAEFYIQKYGSPEAAATRLAKSNPFVTRTMVGVRVAGTAVVLVGAGLSAREVINAPPMERWRVLARQSGGILGSTGGAWGGMKLGGLIGVDIGGPPGAVVGSFVGGCIGACIGNSAGQALVGDVLYQYTVPAAYGGRR